MPDITRERSWVEIDIAAFRHNLRALKRFLSPEQSFLQIVKADAYGHGAAEISRIAIEEGAVALGVANAEEGKLLRLQGCTAPILILSPSLDFEINDILAYNLCPTISDFAFAERLNDAAACQNRVVPVHVKIDTGMNRGGIRHSEFRLLAKNLEQLVNTTVEGVFSHFAASESDVTSASHQQELFLQTIAKLSQTPRYIHSCNSSAVLNGMGKGTNLVRLGILSYGIYTNPDQPRRISVQPVMTFKSRISLIKKAKAGEKVGYNMTWTAAKPTRYAVIPVGYADGYDFLLSNRGKVKIDSTICPVIGRVSMDMICVDISPVRDINVGDEVSLLGYGHDELRAENLAGAYQGSAYELLCQIGRRARRHYIQEGELLHSAPISRRDFVSSDFSDSKLSSIIQAAISQRLRDDEIGEMISREILRTFFYNKDRDIHYRRDFVHKVRFETADLPGYFRAVTTLSFTKVLQNDYFIVACANSDRALTKYFQRKDVEYRWLMDDKVRLDPSSFSISSVRINGISLDTQVNYRDACMEIRCSHPKLSSLVGSEVDFKIDTLAMYPRSAHQFSIFITELTRGVKLSFEHPLAEAPVETVPVFSGQDKYPRITHTPKGITVSTRKGEWVFPLSGVVFSY